MKKIVYLLAVCLCLNSLVGLAACGEQYEENPATEGISEEEAARLAQEAEIKAAEEEAARLAQEEAEKKAAEEEAARLAQEEAERKAAEEEAARLAQEQQTVEQQIEPQQPAEQQPGEPQPAEQQPEGQQSEEQQPEGQQPAEQQPEEQQPEGQQPEGQQPEGQQPEAQDAAGQEGAEVNPPEEQQGTEQPSGEQQPAEQQPEEQQPEGAAPEDVEAWFERDGARTGGTLADVLMQAAEGEKLYLRAQKPVRVEQAPLKLLSTVEIVPDGEVFTGAQYEVRASMDDPQAVEQPALIVLKELEARNPDERAALYFWVANVEPQPEVTSEPEITPEPVDPVEAQLTVSAEDYKEAEWSASAPVFTLSGIPEGKPWSYAAIIYDERIIPLSEAVYIPEEEGVYTLRFAMLDEIGDIIGVSGVYTLWLDWTAPENLEILVDEEQDYTMYVSGSDSVSGVTAVSLNGGEKWHKLKNDDVYTYVGKREKTFAVGAIMIRDAAGNISASESEYTVTKYEPEEEDEKGGGVGGGGGSGEKKKVPSHASGEGIEGVKYDALTLELPEEPMTQLSVGGELMPLTLALESAEEPEAPVGEPQTFTASLERWNPLHEEDQPDTLVLTAELDANLGDQFTYEWHFNGEVYRMLANSGVKYVALEIGDNVCAFPTDGFTGGTKYTELKMLGVSTRRFDYTLAMKVNLNPGYVSAMSDSDYSQECDLSIRTEVENMAYELSSSTKSIMYFYNVFLGPKDMMKHPFGAYEQPLETA